MPNVSLLIINHRDTLLLVKSANYGAVNVHHLELPEVQTSHHFNGTLQSRMYEELLEPAFRENHSFTTEYLSDDFFMMMVPMYTRLFAPRITHRMRPLMILLESMAL